MGTLIQSYGPIYGEIVNGTVQGRPNGSVYVPISNRISLSGTVYLQNRYISDNWRVRFCTDGGELVRYLIDALSQDLASSVRIGVFSDAELTTLLTGRTFTAGRFSISDTNVSNNYRLDADATYYVVAQLMNNGVPVATSDILTCTVVV